MIERSELHVVHGGHKGAEAEFGRAAARWGLAETTLSFEGHVMERAENVEVLSEEELRKGRVSMEFVFERMGRRFVRGKGLRSVIKMMFHMVVRADELFAIGWIKEDGTVKGGTGWGVELAKVFNRRIHVFDQEREAWFTWHDNDWQASEPTLTGHVIGGTGTRNLSEAGKLAIHAMFERSLGPADSHEAAEQTH